MLHVGKSDLRWPSGYKCVVTNDTSLDAPDELIHVFADCMHLNSTTGTMSVQEERSTLNFMHN